MPFLSCRFPPSFPSLSSPSTLPTILWLPIHVILICIPISFALFLPRTPLHAHLIFLLPFSPPPKYTSLKMRFDFKTHSTIRFHRDITLFVIIPGKWQLNSS